MVLLCKECYQFLLVLFAYLQSKKQKETSNKIIKVLKEKKFS